MDGLHALGQNGEDSAESQGTQETVVATEHSTPEHRELDPLDETQKDAWWEKQEPAYQQMLKIAQGHSPETIWGREALLSTFCLSDARAPIKLYVGCMDGRVTYKDKRDRWRIKIGIGANGRLLTPEQFDQFVHNILNNFETKLQRDPRRIKITYHAFCGACEAYCKQINPGRIRQGLPPLDPIEAGREIAQRLTQALGIQETPLFIPSNWLEGGTHKTWHPERMACIDLTGAARPKQLEEDMDSFELSGLFYPNMEHLARELDIAIGIATDEHHGMGRRFHNTLGERRMLITVFEDPLDTELTQNAYSAITPVLEKHQDRVLLVPFRVPKEAVRNRHARG